MSAVVAGDSCVQMQLCITLCLSLIVIVRAPWLASRQPSGVPSVSPTDDRHCLCYSPVCDILPLSLDNALIKLCVTFLFPGLDL